MIGSEFAACTIATRAAAFGASTSSHWAPTVCIQNPIQLISTPSHSQRNVRLPQRRPGVRLGTRRRGSQVGRGAAAGVSHPWTPGGAPHSGPVRPPPGSPRFVGSARGCKHLDPERLAELSRTIAALKRFRPDDETSPVGPDITGPGIAEPIDRTEQPQTLEYVVVPVRRVVQLRPRRVDRLSGAVSPKQPVLQQQLGGPVGRGESSRVAGLGGIGGEADRRGHGLVKGRSVSVGVPVAVPAAVRPLPRDQRLHQPARARMVGEAQPGQCVYRVALDRRVPTGQPVPAPARSVAEAGARATRVPGLSRPPARPKESGPPDRRARPTANASPTTSGRDGRRGTPAAGRHDAASRSRDDPARHHVRQSS